MKTQISFSSILLLASITAILNGGWILVHDYTVFVVFVFAVAFHIFLLTKAPLVDTRQKELERQSQHMQRVEELPERIAAAVERK